MPPNSAALHKCAGLLHTPAKPMLPKPTRCGALLRMAHARSCGCPAAPPSLSAAAWPGLPGWGTAGHSPAHPGPAGLAARVAPTAAVAPPNRRGVLNRPGGSGGAWAAAPPARLAPALWAAARLVPGGVRAPPPSAALLSAAPPGRVVAPVGAGGARSGLALGPSCLPRSVLRPGPHLRSVSLSARPICFVSPPCRPPRPCAPPLGGLRGAPSLRLWGCGPGAIGAPPRGPRHTAYRGPVRHSPIIPGGQGQGKRPLGPPLTPPVWE